jgi:hypothetical protein
MAVGVVVPVPACLLQSVWGGEWEMHGSEVGLQGRAHYITGSRVDDTRQVAHRGGGKGGWIQRWWVPGV